jgi:ABC transport system ATP-binding/permease protein
VLQNIEDLLRGYLGCVVVVSHDRAFMANAVDTMFVLEGDGPVRKFAGNYEEYLDFMTQRVEARQAAAAQEAKAEKAKPAAPAEPAAAALSGTAVRIWYTCTGRFPPSVNGVWERY